ncbi:MAG: SRPBCC domain-containing protein [Caldilineaceae bacterium]|nr:SRPBCC domain-containing protein [Caldilineaceae bacterium]
MTIPGAPDSSSDADAVVYNSIVVPLSPMAAFTLWTEQIHLWWPAGHSRSGDPATHVLLEPGVGGRFYERASDGVEHEWGRILVWQPPAHLAYQWFLGSGPTQPTRVDVYFSAIGDQETLVQVEHRGPDLIGALWWRNKVRYKSAWDVVLPAYASKASKQA